MAGRPGAIEHHPERNAIEDEIMAHVPFRRISSKYGMSDKSVGRYYHERMPAELREAHERERTHRNSDLIAKVRRVFLAVTRLVDEAEQTHDREAKALMLKAAALVLPYAKGIGEMRGDIQAAGPTVNVQNVVNVQVNYGGLPAPVVIEGHVVGENGNGDGMVVSEG